MKFLFCLSILICLYGCISTKQHSFRACKKDLKEALSKNWKYDSEKKKYLSSVTFLNNLDSIYKDCLHGKDTTYVAKFFGNHYKINSLEKGKVAMRFQLVDTFEMAAGVFYFVLTENYKVEIGYFIAIDSHPGRTMQHD